MTVPVDGMGTTSVEAVKAPLVPGVQKPPCQVGKRFRDQLMAALEEKVKKPADLKTRPAWLRQDYLGEPGSLPRRRRLPGSASSAVQALRRLTVMTSSRDLTRMVKERGPQRRTS